MLYIYIQAYAYGNALCAGLYVVLDVSKVALDFEDGGSLSSLKQFRAHSEWSMERKSLNCYI